MPIESQDQRSRMGARAPKASERGTWSPEEHQLFLSVLQVVPRDHSKKWKHMATFFPNRTAAQVRTHALKYFEKLKRRRERFTKMHRSYDTKNLMDDIPINSVSLDPLRQSKCLMSSQRSQQHVEPTEGKSCLSSYLGSSSPGQSYLECSNAKDSLDGQVDKCSEDRMSHSGCKSRTTNSSCIVPNAEGPFLMEFEVFQVPEEQHVDFNMSTVETEEISVEGFVNLSPSVSSPDVRPSSSEATATVCAQIQEWQSEEDDCLDWLAEMISTHLDSEHTVEVRLSVENNTSSMKGPEFLLGNPRILD